MMNLNPLDFDMLHMTLDDLPKVIENEQISHQHPWSENNFKDSIDSGYWAYIFKLKNQSSNTLGDSEVIGHCVFMPGVDEIHLLNITVLPSIRRQHVASRVLRTIEPLALKEDLNKVFLEVRVSNAPAIELYKRNGYQEISRRKNYYRSGYDSDGKLLHEDTIIMVKDLI